MTREEREQTIHKKAFADCDRATPDIPAKNLASLMRSVVPVWKEKADRKVYQALISRYTMRTNIPYRRVEKFFKQFVLEDA